jgi:hypothetical protein
MAIDSGRRSIADLDELDRREIARRYGVAAAYREDAEQRTGSWLRFLGFLLAVALTVLLGAYTLAQATSRDSARRILGRAIPEITDFDATLAAHYDELTAAAASPAGASGVALTGYPIRATLLPREILNRSPSEVRQSLLEHAADAVYEKGSAAFTAEGRPVRFGRFSVLSAPWAFNVALGVLNPGFHARAMKVAKWALVGSVVLGVVLLALSQRYNRPVMYGMALLIAAVPMLVLALIAWLVTQLVFASSLDPLVAGTADLTRDVTLFVVLSYLVYAGLAVAIVIVGLLTEHLGDMFAPSQATSRNLGARR